MKSFTYTTLDALLSVVRDELPSMEQYIDESKVIETVLWCNDKLGINIRKMKETCIKVRNYTANLPNDFQKVIYVAALEHSSFGTAQYRDPFNNFVNDETDYCKVEYIEGCTPKERKIVLRDEHTIFQTYTHWTELSLSPQSYIHTVGNCVNKNIRGKYTINIDEGQISTQFREGELYFSYYGNLLDENNQIEIPFDAQIFPWYRWSIIEKILTLMALNSDQDVSQKLQLAKREKMLAWSDAFNFTYTRTYQEAIDKQKKDEWSLYNRYFAGIQ